MSEIRVDNGDSDDEATDHGASDQAHEEIAEQQRVSADRDTSKARDEDADPPSEVASSPPKAKDEETKAKEPADSKDTGAAGTAGGTSTRNDNHDTAADDAAARAEAARDQQAADRDREADQAAQDSQREADQHQADAAAAAREQAEHDQAVADAEAAVRQALEDADEPGEAPEPTRDTGRDHPEPVHREDPRGGDEAADDGKAGDAGKDDAVTGETGEWPEDRTRQAYDAMQSGRQPEPAGDVQIPEPHARRHGGDAAIDEALSGLSPTTVTPRPELNPSGHPGGPRGITDPAGIAAAVEATRQPTFAGQQQAAGDGGGEADTGAQGVAVGADEIVADPGAAGAGSGEGGGDGEDGITIGAAGEDDDGRGDSPHEPWKHDRSELDDATREKLETLDATPTDVTYDENTGRIEGGFEGGDGGYIKGEIDDIGDARVARIDWVEVDEDVRGQGLSTRLVQAFADECAAQGVARVDTVASTAGTLGAMRHVFGDENLEFTYEHAAAMDHETQPGQSPDVLPITPDQAQASLSAEHLAEIVARRLELGEPTGDIDRSLYTRAYPAQLAPGETVDEPGVGDDGAGAEAGQAEDAAAQAAAGSAEGRTADGTPEDVGPAGEAGDEQQSGEQAADAAPAEEGGSGGPAVPHIELTHELINGLHDSGMPGGDTAKLVSDDYPDLIFRTPAVDEGRAGDIEDIRADYATYADVATEGVTVVPFEVDRGADGHLYVTARRVEGEALPDVLARDPSIAPVYDHVAAHSIERTAAVREEGIVYPDDTISAAQYMVGRLAGTDDEPSMIFVDVDASGEYFMRPEHSLSPVSEDIYMHQLAGHATAIIGTEQLHPDIHLPESRAALDVEVSKIEQANPTANQQEWVSGIRQGLATGDDAVIYELLDR